MTLPKDTILTHTTKGAFFTMPMKQMRKCNLQALEADENV